MKTFLISAFFILTSFNTFAANGCGGGGWSAKSGTTVCLSEAVWLCNDGKLTNSGHHCKRQEEGKDIFNRRKDVVYDIRQLNGGSKNSPNNPLPAVKEKTPILNNRSN